MKSRSAPLTSSTGPWIFGSASKSGIGNGGGEFANVASNWALYQLKGDKKAGAMFVGKSCGLCTNLNWDVESKGLK